MLSWASTLGAQQSAAPRDTTGLKAPAGIADTLTRRNSSGRDTTVVDSATARRRRLAADTVKGPLARAEMPVAADASWHWVGEGLRRAGAVTLADLLARIPGATSMRANWIPAGQFIAWNGDAHRVRVFLDGVELDAIDPRNGDVLDLALMPLWQLEEVSAERAPGELRVHLRSWRVDRTTPITRTDITTGSENTNLYRGYFGKRLHNGGVIQLGAQQSSTTSPRTGGDGSSLQVFGRVGWAGKRWTVDGTVNRASVDRAATIRFPLSSLLIQRNGAPAFKGSVGTSYARIAWGDPDKIGAPWVQLIASSQMAAENSKVSATSALATPSAAPKDTVDSASSRSQYVLAAGASRWGLSGSVTARLRVAQGHRDFSPSARLGYTWSFLSVGAFAESRGADSTRRLDATIRVAPWRWLVLSGAHGIYTPSAVGRDGPAFSASRLELASTWWGVTLSGGMMSRDLTLVGAPIGLDSSLVRVATGQVSGGTVALRGMIFRDLALDVSAVRWQSSGAYRPQMEVHSSLLLDSGFPGKFPRNNFHLLASTTWDHRTPMFFPTAAGGVGNAAGPIDVLGARLEIKIESGTVFFQADNMVGKVYETAPGYMMPRRLQIYGLRWEFWN